MLVKFDSKEKAQQTFDNLDANRKNADFIIEDMALMENRQGEIFMPDGRSVSKDRNQDAIYGGILGAFLGLLGGPVGVLVGASVGVGAGAIADNVVGDDEDDILYKAATLLQDGEVALAALVNEEEPGIFADNFLHENVEIYQWDATEVKEQLDRYDSKHGIHAR